jgi:hypothetical protein
MSKPSSHRFGLNLLNSFSFMAMLMDDTSNLGIQ